MYYGYNSNREITMADKEFLELLGYSQFNEILKNNIAKSLKFENGKIYIDQKEKSVKANYTETEFFTKQEIVWLVKLSNIIETKSSCSTLQLNYHPIYLDVEAISKSIGLCVDDYKLYLDSFIDQSIIDEKNLFKGDDKSIKNLSNLALTLKIPNLSILLLKIKKLSQSERVQYIDEYYTRLALLTLKKPVGYQDDIIVKDSSSIETKEEELNSRFTELLTNINSNEEEIAPVRETTPPKPSESLDDDILDLGLDLDNELPPLINEPPKQPLKTETPKTVQPIDEFNLDDDFTLDELEIEEKPSGSDVKKISLENVKPTPINYNPKIAADELNLPVVLIEEFVEDFIEQAIHDKDHLLASYYQKDMDNIHELGHKLKGAASNLRINELADVLEDIQFCTDYSKLESLLIKYWSLFLSLEEYMKQPRQS